MSWDAEEEVLRILCSDHAIPFFWSIGKEPVTAWIGLTPDGRELTRNRFGQIHTTVSLRNGPDLLVDRKGDTSRLILLDKPWSVPILAERSRLSDWTILPLHQGVVVVSAEKKTWRVEDGRASEMKPGAVGALLAQTASRETDLAQRAAGGPLPDWDGLQAAALLHAMKDLSFAYSAEADVGLYLPVRGSEGRATLNDGALDQEISLPGCGRGPSAVPELIAAPSGGYLLARFKCPTSMASDQVAVPYRHFSYLPGSGAVKPLPVLDSALAGAPAIRLAYLDERTAIWRPEWGETWKILRDGQVRTLWPSQPSE